MREASGLWAQPFDEIGHLLRCLLGGSTQALRHALAIRLTDPNDVRLPPKQTVA